MTQADFSAKWDKRFKDNIDFLISEADLREFKDDCLLVFGAGATSGASAQLLGFDPATGEFLVLLSPAAPKTESSYALAEYAAPPGAGYALRPLPVGAGLAGRILRLPASVASQTLCLLDAQGLPVPLQHLERPAATIWYYVGDPSLQSVSLGELDLTSNVFDPNGLSESNIFFASQFVSHNVFGSDFSNNIIYGELRNCTFGDSCGANIFRPSVLGVKLGRRVYNCYFDAGTNNVELGDYCERVSLYNCAGTAQQPFLVPAGTTDAVYRNNKLVSGNASLLTTAREDVFVDPTYAIPAAHLNTALTLRTYNQASVSLTLPPLTSQLVPALLRIEHQSGQGGTSCLLSVPGLARPLRMNEYALLAAVATPGIPASPHTGYPGQPPGTDWVVLSEPPTGALVVNTTVLRFDKSYTHAPISSGTFATAPATKRVNSEVTVILAPTASDPSANLPTADFQLISGAYVAGVELLYTFRVGANGKIQYVISPLP